MSSNQGRARRVRLSLPALALVAFWVLVVLGIGAVLLWGGLHRKPAARSQPTRRAGSASAHISAAAPVIPKAAQATPAPPAPETFANPHHWPQLAVVVSGMGLMRSATEDAIDSLPRGVTFAFSPYADAPQPLVDRARARGHEVLASLPMDPEGGPRNDEGAHQLSLSREAPDNAADLDWALGRFTGYDGVTNAETGQYGARFATTSGFNAVADALDRRGLPYFTTQAPLIAPARLLVGDVAAAGLDGAAAIDAGLARLEATAESRGCALGFVGPLSPVLVDRLRVWANALPARGVLLLPVAAMLPGGPAPCPAPDSPRAIAQPVAPPTSSGAPTP